MSQGDVISSPAFSVEPMHVGARVVGLAPGAEADPDVRAALYAAWLEHGVLVFPGIDTVERHVALSECFGESEVHPLPEARAEEDERFMEVGGAKAGTTYVFDETDILVSRLAWHRDTAYVPDICKGAMLRMLNVPPDAGETLFADTAMAYDELPADVKARLEGLEYQATLRVGPEAQTRPGAFWKTVREATAEEDPESKPNNMDYAAVVSRYPSVIYPAVIEHPDSGRKCVFLSPTYVDFFIGMEQAESDEFLSYLTEHLIDPRFVYAHSWTVNDAVLWDNRRMMHAAFGNRVGTYRRGLRTTLASDLRPGRYADATAVDTTSRIVD